MIDFNNQLCYNIKEGVVRMIGTIREYVRGYNVRFDGDKDFYFFSENQAKDYFIEVISKLSQGDIVEGMKDLYKAGNPVYGKFIIAVLDNFRPTLEKEVFEDRRLGKKALKWYQEIDRAVLVNSLD